MSIVVGSRYDPFRAHSPDPFRARARARAQRSGARNRDLGYHTVSG